jgi:hypothetical protein
MMMALRREEESVHVAAQTVEQVFERNVFGLVRNPALLGKNLLGVAAVASSPLALENEIEAVSAR